MPYRVNNTFTPASPYGASIQAVTRAMFSGPTPEEREAKLAAAEAQRAHAAHYGAQTDKIRADMAARQRAEDEMKNAPARFAGWLVGDQTKGNDLIAHVRGDQVPTLGAGQTGGMDGGGGDGPAYAPARVPMPQGIDPNVLARVSRGLAGLEMARALPGNDTGGNWVKSVEGLFNDEIRQGARTNTIDTPTVQRVGAASAAVQGKPLMHDGPLGAMDLFTGQRVDPRLENAAIGLTGAKVGSEEALQGQRRAAAGASNAAAGASNALAADRRVQTTQRGSMTTWTDPDTGLTYNVPETTVASERIKVAGRKEVEGEKAALKPEKGAKPRELGPNALKGIDEALTAGIAASGAKALDEQGMSAIRNEAKSIWQRGEAATYEEAVDKAMNKVAPEGLETPWQIRSIIPFTKSKAEIKGGPQKPNPNARQVAPPGAPVAGGKQRIRFDANGNMLP